MIICDVQEKFGEEDHRAPMEQRGEIRTAGVPDSELSETTSYIQSQMHFDDSVESIADSHTKDDDFTTICLKASGNPDALFSSEQGNLIRGSVFRNANPSDLRGSLLEGNKDHLLNQARLDLAKQELHVESLNKYISEPQRQTEEQRLALQDAQYGSAESGREQVRLQEELSMKEKVLRNTQIRNMHEMGETERAQELRVDEVSVQKLSENRETIQQVTSQLQQMQEQMNSVNDSGDFQHVESNFSGKLSYVSSQLAMIQSSRSMLGRDKRLPLDTWNQSGLQENVFGNPFSTFDSPRNHPQRVHSNDVQRNGEAVHDAGRTDTIRASEDRLNQGTIPMPTFATKPLTSSSTMPVELPQNYMVGQQRQQIRALKFDKFPNPQSFPVWKIRFKNQVTTCSDFPSDAMLWIKDVEMVDSVDELKSSRSVCGKDFTRFRDAGREDCVCSEQDHPEFPVQEKGQSRGTGSSERGPFPSRKTDRLHDLRLLSSDRRGEKIRNFDCETLTTGTGRIESGAVVRSRKGLIGVEGGKGICYLWKEKGQCSQGDRCSFRHAQKQNTLPPRLLSQPYHKVEVCRGREAKVTMGPFFHNRADII